MDWREEVLEKMQRKVVHINQLARGIGYTNTKHLEDVLIHRTKDVNMTTLSKMNKYLDEYEESK